MFKLLKIENARQNVPEPEYLPVTNSEEVKIGEALKISSGKLTKHGATSDDTAPFFVAMAGCTAGTGNVIPVMRVTPDMLFLVETQADASAAVLGTKVTLHTDGLQVTATTTKGVATIVDLNGAATSGDPIIVRFA